MVVNDKIVLDYDDVKALMVSLEASVKKLNPDLLVGVARGGVLPALHLSHALDVPVEFVTWSTRDGGDQTFDGLIDEMLTDGKTVVFVDDINDSGLTMTQLVKEYTYNPVHENEKRMKFAALVEKATSCFTTDAYGLRIDDPRWIIFPWEKQ